MDITLFISENGDWFDIKFQNVTLKGGSPMRPNWGGLPDPAEPPVVDFSSAEIVDSNLPEQERPDAIKVFERNDTEIVDRLREKAGERQRRR